MTEASKDPLAGGGSQTTAEGLTRFALRRRVTVCMLFLSLLVVGSIATFGLKQELIPSGLTSQSISVRVSWRDAPPREVLEKVIIPLEDELSTVKGIERLYSTAYTGGARVNINVKIGTDMDVAYREIRDRVERARVVFPEDIDRPTIRKASTANIPVYAMAVIIDPGLHNYYDLIEQEVVMPLQRIDGVADIDIGGFSKKEVIIDIDRAALEASGLNAFRLSQALGDDNFSMASGHTFNAGKKYYLRLVAKYKSLDEIKNRLIAPNIRLKDIATVRYAEAERSYEVRVNGKRATSIRVVKEGSANTIEVAKQVELAVEKLKQKPNLQFLKMEKIFSQGDEIKSSIGNLVDSGKIGALLAAIVLFFFLRRARLTLVIALSIPLSLLVALVAMFFLKQTLNVFTLLGLVICVGLLVDNAVVVAENIYRQYEQENLNKRDACIKGAGEIALAILTATLTTIVVFLPVSLVEGKAQYMLQQLSVPITAALMGSLAIALVFVPLCVYLTLGEKNSGAVNKPKILQSFYTLLEMAYDNSLERLSRFYLRCLAFFLKHRIDMVILLIVAQVLTSGLAKDNLDFTLGVGGNQDQVKITFRAPKGTDYADVKEYFKEIEAVMLKEKHVWHIEDFLVVNFSSGGFLEAWFEKGHEKNIDINAISAQIVERIPEKAGYRLQYGQEDETDEEDKPGRHILMLQGDNPEQLEEISADILSRMLEVDGVIGRRGAQDNTPNELALIVNRDRVAQAQVNANHLAGVVSSALRGRALPKYSHNGQEVNMRVRFDEKDREQLADIGSFYVPAEDDTLLTVAALTDTQMINSAKYISRRDKKISYRVTLEIEKAKTKTARKALMAIQSNYDLPEGVSFNLPPKPREAAQLMIAVALSIVFVYLLMGFLFESFILPLSILLTIPLAMIGVQLGHLVGRLDLDGLGVVGCVLLVGVVVNNGIVLIDYVQRLRLSGMARTEALLLSVKHRFRPITMTALTTIIGMIPLTMSPPGAMGITYKSFGVTLISGMTAATLLTLFVVPVFYSIFDDLRDSAMRLLRNTFVFEGK